MRFQLLRKDDAGRTRRERGQAMVEVALLLPFVFILLLMTIEFGFLMWSHLNVNASAREAARFAAVANIVGNDDEASDCGAGAGPPAFQTVKGRAVTASLSRVICDDVTVKYRDADSNGTFGRGDEVVVRIDHPYDGLTPLVAMMAAFGWGGPSGAIILHACADARLELKYPNQLDPALMLPPTSCNS